MTLLRTLKKLILGETWLLPLGVALVVGAAAVARVLLHEQTWQEYGGFALLAAITILLSLSVTLSTRNRP
jgi:hypothetical protein